MQSNIRSFFQPLARIKSEKEKAEDSHMEDVLISQKKLIDGSEFGEDFPVNSASKKVAKVLKSDDDEEEDSVELDGKDAQADDNKLSLDCVSEQKISEESISPSTSPTTTSSTTSFNIPRRKTARKQLSKRKPQEEDNSYNFHESRSTKRWKEDLDRDDSKDKTNEKPMEGEEVKSENAKLVQHKTNRNAKEKEISDSSKPSSKSISSFFAPKKSSVNIEKQTTVVSENTAVHKCLNKVNNDESNSMADNFLKPSFTLEPAEYNPTKNTYHPVDNACWGPGQKIPYMAVARTFEYIEEESARLKIIETLSNLFRSAIVLSPQDLLPCVYLCLNRLGPAYEGLELGIGKTILMKALAQATGRQLDQIKAEAAEKGDLGLVAENSRTTQGTVFAPPKLGAAAVFGKLQAIGHMAGSSSMNKKIDIIKSLFVACRHSEARYVARSLEGKLRIGLAEQSVLSALAQAASLTPPGQKFPPDVLDAAKGKSADARKAWLDERALIVKQAFCELPNYDIIVPVLLEHGVESLPQYCKITPGIPLKPMLAHPTKGIGEVLKHFEEAAFTCEYKYDGERAQIHILENGEVHIYSRNQENNTTKYPDIVTRVPKVKNSTVKSCILDAEAVAWDPVAKQILPFQVLTTRKRKDVDAAEIQVQVCIYAFDMLYLNGTSLVQKPLSQRRTLLHNSFTEVEGQFLFATSMDTSNVDEIAEFLERSIKDSCEGLMVKTLEVDATYEIAKRSNNWLKLKKDYLEGVGDTLDLVVIGAYLGKGKRAGTYGGFLLACYDEESEEFQSICKIGTGFSDEDLEQIHSSLKVGLQNKKLNTEFEIAHFELEMAYHTRCSEDLGCISSSVPKSTLYMRGRMFQEGHIFLVLTIVSALQDYVIPQPRPYYRWGGTAEPDHWLEAQHVWEVKCADLSISPIHRAASGLVDEEKGISLRFPRFLRIRDDKKPEEATSSAQVAELYRKQQQIQNQLPLEKDDFY